MGLSGPMVDPEGLSRLGSLIPDWPCRVKKVVHAHLGNTSRLIKLSKANLYFRELELIQPHMAQKSVLRVEVGCAWRGEGGATTWGYPPRELFGFVRLCIFSYLIEAQRRAQYCGGSAFVS